MSNKMFKHFGVLRPNSLRQRAKYFFSLFRHRAPVILVKTVASAFQITVLINTIVTVHPDTMGTTVKQVNYRTGMKEKILCFQPLRSWDKFEEGTALH